MRLVGLTPTPYRLDYGRLDEEAGRLLDKVVYSYGIGEAIADDWLVPLVADLIISRDYISHGLRSRLRTWSRPA